MNKLRDIIAANLIYLRKKNNFTQQELASKINYSDNAISRWERGEVIPTIETLEILAAFYGINVQDLLDAQFFASHDKPQSGLVLKRIFIALFSISIVWFIAIISYIYIDMFKESFGDNAKNAWLLFIAALPVSTLVGVFYNRMWGTKLLDLIAWSLFAWTLLTTIYLYFLAVTSQYFWLIFILGVPAQVALILWYFIRR
jgi:transcriptional regulator with XRE-family HTH domain